MQFPQDILDYEEFTLMEIGVLAVLLLGSDDQKKSWRESDEFNAIISFLAVIDVLEKNGDGGMTLNSVKNCNFAILNLDEKKNPVYIHKNFQDDPVTKDLVGGQVAFICQGNVFFSLDEVEEYLES